MNNEDSTLVSPEELQKLIPKLTTKKELDEFEAANIAKAMFWAGKSRALKRELLSFTGLMKLHKKMFDETWSWAGEPRKRQTNIGIAPKNIQTELAQLFGDIKYWQENSTFPMDGIAVRFHHRLVWIHPFTNGNGRFARFATNLFLSFNGEPGFTWGQMNLVTESAQKKAYISALKRADLDRDDVSALLKFAKT